MIHYKFQFGILSLVIGICLGFGIWLLGFPSQAAVDLSEIGVGARSLSMGKAYAGGINDAAAIFTNPAGLTLSPGLNAISMSGSLLSDVTYLVLGASNDLPIGKIGVGYISASIPGISLTSVEGTGASLNITQTGLTDYGSSLFFFSYASKLSEFFRGKGDNISVGANIKYFFQGFSGDTDVLQGADMQNARGTGMDADVGLALTANTWARLGLTVTNLLPVGFGGKFVWERNNAIEGIPMVIRVGGAFRLLGERALRENEDHAVSLLLDYETAGNSQPALWHMGLEYWPLTVFTFRLGINQEAKATESGIGVDNNFTAGVGINFRGFTFDYAYYQSGELSENTTHFFSLGYKEISGLGWGGERKKTSIPVAEVVPKPKLKSFADLPRDYWAKAPIEYVSTLGIMGGYPDNTFRPDKVLTRGELAAILVKAKGFDVKAVNKTEFKDVLPGDWSAPYVNMVVKRKYMGGYPDRSFRPHKKITRAEAALIFAKFSGLYMKKKVQQNVFPDVSRGHWVSPALAATKQAGFFEYLSNKDFEPTKYLTRAETAEILSKTPFVKEKIKRLISGES